MFHKSIHRSYVKKQKNNTQWKLLTVLKNTWGKEPKHGKLNPCGSWCTQNSTEKRLAGIRNAALRRTEMLVVVVNAYVSADPLTWAVPQGGCSGQFLFCIYSIQAVIYVLCGLVWLWSGKSKHCLHPSSMCAAPCVGSERVFFHKACHN